MKVYADPDHGKDLQEKFSTLWRKGKFFDTSLGVASRKLYAHKLVLLAMSPFLQEAFRNADQRSQLDMYLPIDVTYKAAEAFLKYIYEGVLEVDTSSVRSLHKIATMLLMTKLAQYCQNFTQQLREEADQAKRVRGREGEIPQISVNLEDLAESQRLRNLEAQQLQEGHVSVEEAHSAKRLVKKESSIHEAMEHSFTGAEKIQHQASPLTTERVYTDPDHVNDFQEKLSTLWKEGKFFDASLLVTNKKLHAHKLVLLAMSPYLQEECKNGDPRACLNVILPLDTTYETAKAFLKYIYEGVLEIDTSSFRSLHKIARLLQMTKLAQYCQNFTQHLQEEADQAKRVHGGGEGEIPQICQPGRFDRSSEVRNLEAQALQRLGETSMASSDLHHSSAVSNTSEYAQLKGESLSTGDQTSTDQMDGT